MELFFFHKQDLLVRIIRIWSIQKDRYHDPFYLNWVYYPVFVIKTSIFLQLRNHDLDKTQSKFCNTRCA